MKNVLIINGHQPYPFSEGRLNQAFVDRAAAFAETHGASVRVVRTADPYDVEAEIKAHQEADVIVMQFPVNWMGVPWSMKKYMDEVYTAGMDGRLCAGDGRTSQAPKAGYGTGGALRGRKYMLSLTFNAPVEAFGDPAEPLFKGRSVDDLMLPMHANAAFFGLDALPTYAAHDVMKDPQIEADLERFDAHLEAHLRPVLKDATHEPA